MGLGQGLGLANTLSRSATNVFKLEVPVFLADNFAGFFGNRGGGLETGEGEGRAGADWEDCIVEREGRGGGGGRSYDGWPLLERKP